MMSRNNENDLTPAQADEQRESHVLSLNPREQLKRRERGKRLLFTLVAALLALVVIVGSYILINHSSQNKQPVLLPHVTGPGLYAYLGNAVYQLDNRTHQVVWKHTFASNEAVQGDPPSSSAPGQPFVAGSVLYLETRDWQHNDRQYLYAFNTADGSVLWRQLSARALANGTAVYTLVESKTAHSSTLTARDVHTSYCGLEERSSIRY
jgi:hypothetical protein